MAILKLCGQTERCGNSRSLDEKHWQTLNDSLNLNMVKSVALVTKVGRVGPRTDIIQHQPECQRQFQQAVDLQFCFLL